METQSSGIGNSYRTSEEISGLIFASWLQRSGVEKRVILNELEKMIPHCGRIGMKSFIQWTSEGKSARLVSGPTTDIKAERLIAMVKWFINEHAHRLTPVVNSQELRDLMAQYADLPVLNRLRLKRLLHDLEMKNGEREPNFSFASDWKSHFAQWPVFCFVVDSYWCVRASTSYEMALAGYTEEDMYYWSWWHRLTASQRGQPKFDRDSKRYSLRGPYSEAYYSIQMGQFLADTEALREANDKRYHAVMELLNSTDRFAEVYKAGVSQIDLHQQSFGLPVPFFRSDGALLWMLEVSSAIPKTDNYRLIAWIPLNQDSAEYQGEIQRQVDVGGKYSKKAYFIEDYAQHFSPTQRFALGVR